MRRFAELYRRLDQTTSTNRKVAAIRDYLQEAPAVDAAWAIYVLSGQRQKRLVNTRLLRDWTTELTGYQRWLVSECYSAVGDLAETIALLLDDPAVPADEVPLHVWMEQRLPALRRMDDAAKRVAVTGWWQTLDFEQRFLLNKLITGALRVGISRRLVTRAVAETAGIDSTLIAHRLMGDWAPSAEAFERLLATEDATPDSATPYPFFLASPLDQEVTELGDPADWCVEWKWDGIRAQLIRRGGQTWIWSRGEDQLTGRFPEIEADAERIPDGVVMDGEIMAWRDDAPLPFAILQRRIGRKRVGEKLLREAPVSLLVYDLLEVGGDDLRALPLSDRRRRLEGLLAAHPLERMLLSAPVEAPSWSGYDRLRATSRDRLVEGFVLKRWSSPYQVGRRRGDWWKWKVDPHTVDAVLVYAQPGHGRRSGLLTDYTFAVWTDDQTLVPIAKAYSGLTNEEIETLDRWIRRHTTDRYGPVRAVEPHHVFELAFEGIARSSRHKSGVAVRFPRIARWRHDKPIGEADRLTDLRRLLR